MSQRLQLVVSDERSIEIQAAAARCGMSVSAFIGRLIREGAIESIVAVCDPQLLVCGRAEWFKRVFKKKPGRKLLPALVGED